MTSGVSADQITTADATEEQASSLVSEDDNKRPREGDELNPGKKPKTGVFPTTQRPAFVELPMDAARRFTTPSSDAEPRQYHDSFRHNGWPSGAIPELIYNPVVNRDSTHSLRLMAISGQINLPSSFAGRVDPYRHLLPTLSTIDTQLLRHQPLLAPSPSIAVDPFYALLLSTLQGNSAANSVLDSSLALQLSLMAQASVRQAANRSILHGAFSAPVQHYGNALGVLSRLQGDQVGQGHHKKRKQGRDPKLDGLTLYVPEDRENLSEHQTFLRSQIEYFRATQEDTVSITRGKNKPIFLMQVGIRCRHCSHVAAGRRKKGSTYFPSTLMGIYQACQNIGVDHLQSGLCTEATPEIIERLTQLASNKHAASGVGKKYWAEKAERLGLVDTEEGIRFAADL